MFVVVCPCKGIGCKANPQGIERSQSKDGVMICSDIRERFSDQDRCIKQDRVFYCSGNCKKQEVEEVQDRSHLGVLARPCIRKTYLKYQEVRDGERRLHL